MSCHNLIKLNGQDEVCLVTETAYPNCQSCKLDTENDVINSPKHYDFPVQPLVYARPIIAEMDGYEGACTKDIIKYISRWKRKNGIEDVRKAMRYCELLIGYLIAKGE